MESNAGWPELPWEAWHETATTLHMWLQVVGKVKLALSPFLNEWWQVTLFVSARGLASGPIPYGQRAFDVELDFIEHNLTIRSSDGGRKALPLIPRSVARFYSEFMTALAALGIEVAINPVPCEVPNPISCDTNEVNASYDPEYAERWWRILVHTERVLQRFRTPFVGKSSPVDFFWGSFDLSHTRFSGRPATPPAGAPRFFQLAEDQENFTCGFWPGNATLAGPALGEPAFFAYAYPAPPGISEAAVRPDGAFFHPELGEFLLPYEQARRAPSPEQAIADFLHSSYEAAASSGGWNRGLLERPLQS